LENGLSVNTIKMDWTFHLLI